MEDTGFDRRTRPLGLVLRESVDGRTRTAHDVTLRSWLSVPEALAIDAESYQRLNDDLHAIMEALGASPGWISRAPSVHAYRRAFARGRAQWSCSGAAHRFID